MSIYMYYVKINVTGQGKASNKILDTESFNILVNDEANITNRNFDVIKSIILRSRRCPKGITYNREFEEILDRFLIIDFKLLYQVNGKKAYKDNKNMGPDNNTHKEKVPESDSIKIERDQKNRRNISSERYVQTFFGRRMPILQNKILNNRAISGYKYIY